MRTLVRVFYVSEIVEPLSDVDVQVILGTAQMKNRRLDVTGMLAQSDGHFAQVLEGRREPVDEVLSRVSRDVRHRAIRIISEEPITRRQFERWAMGLIRRDDMADAMRELHQGSSVELAIAREMISRLMTLSA